MLREEYARRIRFIVQFARGLHAVGSPAHTLEAALLGLCERLQLRGEFASSPTSILCSFRYLDEDITRIVRVYPGGMNLARLCDMDEVAKDVINGQLEMDEGSARLEDILAQGESFPLWVSIIGAAFSAGGMMALFGGSWTDFVASSLIGALIGLLSFTREVGPMGQLYEASMALVASFAGTLLGYHIPTLNGGAVILASLIMFMPGLNITIAIAEIATQNLTSGTTRLVGGVMVLLKLTFGVVAGKILAEMVLPPGKAPIIFHVIPHIPSWFVWLSVPVTAAMSTVVLKARWRDASWVTLAGVYGYVLSKTATAWLGAGGGVFIGGLGVGMAANLFARRFGRPSSLFQFPGLILLVPGSVGFRGLAYLHERNIVMGFDTAFTMLTVAFSLVMGVFVGNVLIKPRTSL